MHGRTDQLAFVKKKSNKLISLELEGWEPPLVSRSGSSAGNTVIPQAFPAEGEFMAKYDRQNRRKDFASSVQPEKKWIKRRSKDRNQSTGFFLCWRCDKGDLDSTSTKPNNGIRR
jgi:hypothetical protein